MLYLVVSLGATLLWALAFHSDTRKPISTKFRYKYMVKEDSIFRKILKFKDEEYYPCNYFKIVPIYIYLILLIISICLFIFDMFLGGYINDLISENDFLLISLILNGLYLIYYTIIVAWWEIKDSLDMRFTKEEKEELKKLRKLRKMRKHNNHRDF